MASTADATEIYRAVAAGSIERIDQLLLQAGSIDSNVRLPDLIQKALIKASFRGQAPLVRHLLVRWSADPNYEDPRIHATPLSFAARRGYLSIVAELLKAGADPDMPEQRWFGCRPLYYAASFGHKQIVELLFRSGATGDNRVDERYCALNRTVGASTQEDIVRLLVCNPDINPSFLDVQSLTNALCSAAGSGQTAAVELLLGHGADPSLPRLKGRPIQLAAKSDSEQIIDLLLTAGANPDPVETGSNKQAVIVAAECSSWPIVNKLLSAIRDISGNERNVCLLNLCANAATSARNYSVLRELLQFPTVVDYFFNDESTSHVLYQLASSKDPTATGIFHQLCQRFDHCSLTVDERKQLIGRALCHAATSSDPRAVRLLLNLGIFRPDDLDPPDRAAIVQSAFRTLDFQVAAVLLEEVHDQQLGTNPAVNLTESPVCIAKQLLDFYSKSEADRKQLIWHSLIDAARYGQSRVVQLLISLGFRPADLNITDSQWILLRALGNNSVLVVSVLLENGLNIAELIKQSPDGLVRCLDGEAANNACSSLRLILSYLTPEQTQRIAHAAIAGGFIALSLSLVANFVNLSCRAVETDGWTLLMRAASRGYADIVKALLENGADLEETVLDLQKSASQSALDIARSAGHQVIVDLLLRFSTQTDQEEDSSSESPADDVQKSLRLHQLLLEAGFTRERAQFQCQMAEFLQKLAVKAYYEEMREMTGSFSDGWGNSLVQVTGRTARDSDIDWTVIQEGEKFHLFFGCQCSDRRGRGLLLKVVEGHCLIDVQAGTQPAVAAPPCGIRPAQDTCYAYMCCSSFYTHRINILLGDDSVNCEGNVHLVRATRPDKTAELRVSFSFQERKALRSLTTVQGQLFILLKFLFKRLIPKTWNAPGLKTYHAKTLLFFMLEKKQDDPDEWKPERLIALFRESLLLMLQLTANEPKPEVCMPHFFLEGAPLFFKSA
uniref:ANK_REP_REGION domain-containing protein n=1 Tax=Macrostomum lignano TaxID=282301 RepID=A0A1I8GDN2_9PLAT